MRQHKIAQAVLQRAKMGLWIWFEIRCILRPTGEKGAGTDKEGGEYAEHI